MATNLKIHSPSKDREISLPKLLKDLQTFSGKIGPQKIHFGMMLGTLLQFARVSLESHSMNCRHRYFSKQRNWSPLLFLTELPNNWNALTTGQWYSQSFLSSLLIPCFPVGDQSLSIYYSLLELQNCLERKKLNSSPDLWGECSKKVNYCIRREHLGDRF